MCEFDVARGYRGMLARLESENHPAGAEVNQKVLIGVLATYLHRT
ncbi:hypothetical protein [Kribbella ginsengisoli]